MNAVFAALKAVKPAWWLAIALIVCLILCFLPQSATQSGTDVERALAKIEGAGEVRVAVYYAQTDAGFGVKSEKLPQGAVIVASGASDMTVRLMLLRAAQTLLGLPLERIEVFPMEVAQ